VCHTKKKKGKGLQTYLFLFLLIKRVDEDFKGRKEKKTPQHALGEKQKERKGSETGTP